jgi:proline dehydrogenase
VSISRDLLLRASRSRGLARQLARRAFLRRALRRFMPGEELSDALDAAERFAAAGIGAVLTQLGENVTNLAEAEAVRDHYLGVLQQLEQRGLPAHLSVKLTHLGLDVDRATCEQAVRALAARAARAHTTLWIDMEDSHYTDATLDLFRRVRADHPSVGLCLQAYLRRTGGDLEQLLGLAPAIRLVKGAYAEAPTIAFPRKREVDASYFALAARLLEEAAQGRARPVFGTHDMRLIGQIRGRAASLGLSKGAYEFHLLYGIREADQRSLAAEGETLRVLISYGSAWFAWYLRRLAERPANVWFVLKNLVAAG